MKHPYLSYCALSSLLIFSMSMVIPCLAKTVDCQPLHILFVVEKFPMIAETTILNQVTGLLDKGHDVHVYSTAGKGYLKKVHNDFNKYDLAKRTFYSKPPSDLSRFDIIYVQFGPLALPFVEKKKKGELKAKLVTCFRGYDLSRYIKQKGTRVYKELFKYGDLFLPVCDYFKDRLIKFGCPASKIITQHSAIDLSRFAFKARSIRTKTDTIRIISVCRLIEKKGVQYTVEAVGKLLAKYPNIEYTIVGDGPLMRTLRRLARSVRGRTRIKFFGCAKQNEVIDLFRKAHIAILGSTKGPDGNEEGIPNALKEAMAMGIPVVATDSSGIPELVEHGVSGYVVEQRNANALAKKIEYLITHPEIWKKMGQAGRVMVEDEFDVKKMNDRLVKIFRELLVV